MNAYDVGNARWLFRGRITGAWEPPPEQFATRFPAWIRAVVWVLILLLLPWLTAPATHIALESKSNVASLVLLLAYTGVDMLTVLILTGFRVAGAGPLLLLVGATAIALGYNYWACEAIAERSR
jgi:NAD/NADP transhydrogenase alpha subunit